MESSIATLLKKFGIKIGLGETLDLGNDGNIRLNLGDDLGVDFEEDASEPDFRKKLWIYITISHDDLTKEQLVSLLEAMHEYHRSIEARLIIPKNGFSVVLASFFPSSLHEPASTPLTLASAEELSQRVDELDTYLQNLLSLATFLRSLIGHNILEQPTISSPPASPINNFA